MGNRFSTNFRSRAQAGQIPAAALEFTIAGTDYRYSDEPIASLSQGMFKPQILNWGGSLAYSADDRNNSLQSPSLSVTIADHDNTLSNLFYGVNARSVFNSSAVVYLAYSDIAFSDWFTVFTGRIAAKSMIEPKVWQIDFRFDDTSLAAETADLFITVVDEAGFPTADNDSLGKQIPIIYGKREWDGTGQTGDVQAIYCSTDGDPDDLTAPYRYVVCAGHATNIPKIWVDGSATDNYVKDTDWFWTERNGCYYTEVGFSGVQTEPVTVDVWGLSTSGTGSTTEADLITNPAKQIEHVLLNFIFNRWRSGIWLTEGKIGSTPIDTASITTLETHFDDRSVIGSSVLTRQSALSLLNGWLQQHFCAAWWNEAGKLQFGVRSPYDSDVYLDDNTPANWPWFKAPIHGRGQKPIFPLRENDARVVERITMNIGLVNKDNRYSGAKFLQDFQRTAINSEEVLDISWGRAESGTSHNIDAMARRLRRDRFSNNKLEIVSSVVMLDPDLFDSVLVSDPNAPHPSSAGWGDDAIWKPRLFTLMAATINLNTKEVSCVLEDERFFRSTLFDSGAGEISQLAGVKLAQGIFNGRASDGWTFTRATNAWIPNLSGKIVQLGSGNTKRTPDGWLFESQATNWVYNSAYVKSWTNWTGVGSGTRSLDTAVRLFEDETADDLSGTNQTAKLLTTAGPNEIRNTQQTAHSFGANDPVSFSVWHKDSGNPVRIRIQNDTTTNWLTTGGSWNASEQNASAFSTATDWTRDEINFVMESTGSTLTLHTISPNGANNYTHLAHVQLEDWFDAQSISGAFATSVIVTDSGNFYQRAVDSMFVSNSSSTGRVWRWWEQGTARCIWKPLFDGGDLASGAEKVLLSTAIDGSDYVDILYENSSGTYQFVWGKNRAPGCSIEFTVVAGDEYYVIARWVGPNGELDETDGTFKLLVQDVDSGTWYSDDATVSTGAEAATASATIGRSAATGSCDGYIRDIEILPFVLTDEECKAYP